MTNAIPGTFGLRLFFIDMHCPKKHVNHEDIDADHDHGDAIQGPEVAFLCALSEEVTEKDYY